MSPLPESGTHPFHGSNTMSVLVSRKALLVILLVAFSLMLVASVSASPLDISTGPGDWGGMQGRPDDFGQGKPATGGLLWFEILFRALFWARFF
jgi:hypothetical protein